MSGGTGGTVVMLDRDKVCLGRYWSKNAYSSKCFLRNVETWCSDIDVLGCMLVLLLVGLGQIAQQVRDERASTRPALRARVEECARNKNGMWIIGGVQLHSHLGYYCAHYKGKL
jgi:hypothetical protein